MRAHAHVEVATIDGRTVLPIVRSEPPLTIRRCGERVLIVGSAAAPVGGDELTLDVAVRPGARADLGTAAATMVWPGVDGSRSITTTNCTVGAGGHLDWHPEPTVSVQGSQHLTATTVRLATGATARIVEEVSLGRHRQPSGHLELQLRIERSGRPLVHHTERFGPDVPGAGGVVGVGAARHVCCIVLVGVAAGGPRTQVDGDRAGSWLPVADDAAVVLAVGPDRPSVLELVGVLAPEAAV